MSTDGSDKIGRVWDALSQEARLLGDGEPALAWLAKGIFTKSGGYPAALINLVSETLRLTSESDGEARKLIEQAINSDSELVYKSALDLEAFLDRDPACSSFAEAFLFYRGFKALQAYRVARFYWNSDRRAVARYLQSLIVDCCSMDLHPGARIEGGVFIDHGTGIVIGETAQVERNVSILHNVTLGGTGKVGGQRHPKISEGVMLGAGCKVLGNITVGRNSKVAAGSIVLADVPENTTAVGIPARMISKDQTEVPAYDMKQDLGN
ncbi:MAG: serine O-acetyltransferase [Pseudomonadota bacterium]